MIDFGLAQVCDPMLYRFAVEKTLPKIVEKKADPGTQAKIHMDQAVNSKKLFWGSDSKRQNNEKKKLLAFVMRGVPFILLFAH